MKRTYGENEKAVAVGRALAVGATKAGKELGIPRRTIDQWKSSPAFAEMRQRVREDVADEMWAAVQIAVSEVIDSLQSPRTPLRDKAQALGILYDRYALLTGSATSRAETRDITESLSDADLVAALREAQSIASRPRDAEAAEGSSEG